MGIREPIFSTLALDGGAVGTAAIRDALRELPEADEILDAAETGDTKALEHHLGTLRRVTGVAKAHAVAELVKEEIESGKMQRVPDVLAHRGDRGAPRPAQGLQPGCPGRIDPAAKRAGVIEAFQNNRTQVFIGQIIAAGEAIDLSVSRDLIFVDKALLRRT